ncbi:hypothetical protein ACFYTQ_10035 [Nocardia sp. NPDC004068]|uniref:hypothetical protein n=1 Tax=Nocardia sp. NPDC004068 TaxID=3364303 RepID=UPI0036A100C6
MGEYRPHTAAEIARMEQDQHDPKWLAWVAPELMETKLRKFFTDTVPDMPDDPWTAEGLDHAERAALVLFPTVQSTRLTAHKDAADQFHRFIGEVFRRRFEGKWYNSPEWDDSANSHGFGPVIEDQFSDMFVTPVPMLTMAIHRATGQEWSRIFHRVEHSYHEWKQNGRPLRDTSTNSQ